MTKLKPLEYIFSVKRNNNHKLITILGVKISFKTQKLPIKQLSEIVTELHTFKRELIIRQNYERILKKIRKECKNRKINIIFLCNSNSFTKFSYSSLYEEFAKNLKFNVKLLVSYTTNFKHNTYEKEHYKNTLVNNFKFFKNKKYDVEYAYDIEKEEFIDLEKFNPDIIFYVEPWEIAPNHDLSVTSRFALSCFCCYGTTIHNGTYEYTVPFYRHLYKYFIDNYYARNLMIEHDVNPDSLKVFGSIKLDAYLKPIDYNKTNWKFKDKKKVIYAPHHSFSQRTYLKYGTFDKNYKFFLEYAQKHPDIEFILKPHPVLKKEIITRKLMNEKEMKNYFETWANLPNAQICEDGDYYDMFRTSDLMITDCNSFLSEYLPTEKPLIHLISEHSVGHNEYGQKIIRGYYQARTNQDIEKHLNNILYKNHDPLLELRREIIANDLVWERNGTAKGIVKYLENIIFDERNNNE